VLKRLNLIRVTHGLKRMSDNPGDIAGRPWAGSASPTHPAQSSWWF